MLCSSCSYNCIDSYIGGIGEKPRYSVRLVFVHHSRPQKKKSHWRNVPGMSFRSESSAFKTRIFFFFAKKWRICHRLFFPKTRNRRLTSPKQKKRVECALWNTVSYSTSNYSQRLMFFLHYFFVPASWHRTTSNAVHTVLNTNLL